MLTRPLHDQPSLYGPYTRSSLIQRALSRAQVEPSFRSGIAVEMLGGIVMVVSNLFVIGLARVASKMQDPFGNDIEDLSVRTL